MNALKIVIIYTSRRVSPVELITPIISSEYIIPTGKIGLRLMFDRIYRGARRLLNSYHTRRVHDTYTRIYRGISHVPTAFDMIGCFQTYT